MREMGVGKVADVELLSIRRLCQCLKRNIFAEVIAERAWVGLVSEPVLDLCLPAYRCAVVYERALPPFLSDKQIDPDPVSPTYGLSAT